MVIELPKRDIYKVRVLDSDNNTKTILVFCKGNNSNDKNQIFSQSELDEIEHQEIPIVYSEAQIYLDDTIHSIKKKIINELNQVAYPELYLFCKIPQKVDYIDLHKAITKKENEALTYSVMKQLFSNYNIDLPNNEHNKYDFEDIELAFRDKDVIQNISLGTMYEDGESTYMFAANPCTLSANNIGILKDDKSVVLLDNHLLLNYHFGRIHDETIYVVEVETVLEHCNRIGLDEKYAIRTYFPLLYKNGISSLGDWIAEKQQMLKENDKIINKNTMLYQKSIDIFYDIYNSRNGHEIQYLKRGITNIKFKIKSSIKAAIPLESVFKSIHSTRNIPFIKWNPGTRRENVYRLYTEMRTNDGKHIPFLPENMVIRLSKEIGKSKQIAMYIQDMDIETKKVSSFFQVSIEQNGDILVSSTYKSPISLEQLIQLLKTLVNPVIIQMNGNLKQLGYSIPIFESFYNSDIEIIQLNYVLESPLNNDLNFGKYIGCISSVFDIIEDNEKTGTTMRYKRVENFREMDAQTLLINEIYKKTEDLNDIINALMQNYKMSEDDANQRVIEYLASHKDVRGKIIDNPGFPVNMKVSFFDKTLTIMVDNILSISYLDTIHVYLDSMIRLSQYSDTVKIPKKELQSVCMKVVKIDKDVLNPYVDNVVSTAVIHAPTIQPIRFSKTDILGEKENTKTDEADQDIMDEDDEGKGAIFYEEDEEDDSGAIFYEDDDEEGLEGGANTPPSSPEDNAKSYSFNPVGQSLTNPTIFFKRMKQLDPELFVSEESGKFLGYSRLCQSAKKRQPIILTKEEKAKIDKESPHSYTEALKYGSDADKQHYYICPRYWCLLTNMSMTEEDIIAGKCAKKGKPDKIIPANAKTVPNDAFVYEFNHPIQHYEKGKGEYHMGYPGFLKEKTPNGNLMPCCFKNPRKNWKYLDGVKEKEDSESEEEESEMSVKKPPIKTARKRSTEADVTGYIMSNETFPIRQMNRFGFLPLTVQHFLQLDSNKCVTENNAALIKPNSSCVLRSSVEQKPNQSIMGCFAELYAHSHQLQESPSVDDFKKIIQKNITIDKFIQYNNSYLVSVFKPNRVDLSKIDISKYAASDFYKSIQLDDEYQIDFLEDTIAAYENYMDFLMSDKSVIDHQYLWDMMTDDNPNMIIGGVNLFIMELMEDDITGNIRVLCPTNSRNKLYDATKKTFILVKRDIFYEPLCIYKDVDGKIHKAILFMEHASIKQIDRIMKIISKSMQKYCVPNPSLPKIYNFKKNVDATQLYHVLGDLREKIHAQLVNYQYKTIGFIVGDKEIYVPCSPGAPLKNIEKRSVYHDEMWNDYYTTVDELKRLSQTGKILCMPRMKVMEDGLIVGILTETNQFVPVNQPIENVVNDDLPIMNSSNYNIADKLITSNKKEDIERSRVVQNISLETQFYSVFRTIVREALNSYESRNVKQKIMTFINNSKWSYLQKIKAISNEIVSLVKDNIVFNDFDEDVLMSFGDLICNEDIPSEYCVVKNNKSTLIIPKRHLITGKDNEKIYYGRIADELLRYRRIRLFMMNDKNYLNITNDEYKINEDEFILIQTSLNNDYLKNLVPLNTSSQIQNTNFINAQPQVSQKYSTERIPIQEQLPEEMTSETEEQRLNENILECVNDTVDVIGNPQQSLWKRIFPRTTKEIKFKNTSHHCSFYVLIAMFQMENTIPISVMSVKTALSGAYKSYMEKYKKSILKLLRIQGKTAIVSGIEKGQYTLETAIMSPEYYISDLDVLVFAKYADIQVCLFTGNGLRSINKPALQWYISGKNYGKKHYFVRSPTITGSNRIGEYHLINRTFSLNELGEFERIVQNAISGLCSENDPLCSSECIESIESIFQKV